jgi:hypothetical protein
MVAIKIEDNQLRLPNGNIITFNDEQYVGINKIRKWLEQANGLNNTFTLAGFAGTGKEQPVDSIVQTPKGPTKIGDLKIGDEVFGLNGEINTVNGVYPQGYKQAYKVTFRDKTFTECGEEHLWEVWTHKRRQTKKPTITMPLKDIIKSALYYEQPNGDKIYKYSIPLCEPVNYIKKELPIDPYLLGVLIGDGYLCGNSISISNPYIDYEIIENIKKTIPSDIIINFSEYGSCPSYRLVDINQNKTNKLKVALKNLGLNIKSIDKFIPNIYKYSSIEQRYELLRGLMDTDGTSRGNRIGFSTSSFRLMNDIIELVQSLGGVGIRNKDDIRKKNTNYSVNINKKS